MGPIPGASPALPQTPPGAAVAAAGTPGQLSLSLLQGGGGVVAPSAAMTQPMAMGLKGIGAAAAGQQQ